MTHNTLQSTRLRLTIIALLAVSAAYVWADVTAQQWIDFIQWALGIYAASEGVAKGAVAYRDRVGE